MLTSSCREELVHPGGCLAASAGSGAEPQGSIANDHPYKTSPYLNIRTSNRVITLNQQPELIDAPTLEAPYLSGGHFRRQPSDLLH